MIKYIGPVTNSSGYSNAARNNIIALVRQGVDLSVHPISFEQQITTHGEFSNVINSYIGKQIKDHRINIIHCTPENWPKFINSNKYNIGYTTWETDKLPESWVPLINLANEVWVPSRFNVEVFKNSGVTKPIKLIPHTLCEDTLTKSVSNKDLDLPKDLFKFYSIFQWTKRKGPYELLEAYLTEFKPSDKVCLILKTYHMGWNLAQQNIIRGHIKDIKDKLNLSEFPPIFFIGDLLTDGDVFAIHRQSDCFVLPHYGEGFGIPLAEAMLFEKPVITTNWSGSTDFCTDQTSYLVDYNLQSVTGMPWEKYTSDQKWAEPQIESVKKQMRYVFMNQEEARLKATHAKNYVKENFSHEVIGNLMKSRIEEILNGS